MTKGGKREKRVTEGREREERVTEGGEVTHGVMRCVCRVKKIHIYIYIYDIVYKNIFSSLFMGTGWTSHVYGSLQLDTSHVYGSQLCSCRTVDGCKLAR